MKLICIGHHEPLFDIHQPFRMVSSVPLDLPNAELIPDDIWGERYDGRVLSEFLQLFVLAEQLDAADDEPIYLFQYRKFIMPARTPDIPLGDTGVSYTPDEAAKAFPSRDVLAALRGPIVGAIMPFDVAQQFAANHAASDFVCFSMALRDSGLFSNSETIEFVRGQFLIPSATLGIFPTSTLVRHMGILRKVWEVYRDRYYVPRTGYQKRVGGYLMERLHSFLILKDAAEAQALLEQWDRVVVEPTVR